MIFFFFLAGICSEEFSFTSQNAQVGKPTIIDDTSMSVSVNVRETLPLQIPLYTISWESESTTEPKLDEKRNNNASNYINFEIDWKENSMEFSVLKSMAKLVDYIEPERIVSLFFYF